LFFVSGVTNLHQHKDGCFFKNFLLFCYTIVKKSSVY